MMDLIRFLEIYAKSSEGYITVQSAELDKYANDPNSPFVHQLSSLSDADFISVIERMKKDAIKAYLYAKYSEFFRYWDRGRKLTSRLADGLLDGTLTSMEIMEGGGLQKLLQDVLATISDPRDRLLLLQITWFKDPATQALVRDELQHSIKAIKPLQNAGLISDSNYLPRTADEFIKKHAQMWDAATHEQLSSLSLESRTPESRFVVELSLLSDSEFLKVSSLIPTDVFKIYLYNKYWPLFERWDTGIVYEFKRDKRVVKAEKMNGYITVTELKDSGGLPVFLKDVIASIKDLRDIAILRRCRIFFYDEQQTSFYYFLLEHEHETRFRNLCIKLPPGNFSEDLKSASRDCVHTFKTNWQGAVPVTVRSKFKREERINLSVPDRLEFAIKCIQKFWLRLVLRRKESFPENEIQCNVEWLDQRYAIHTNSAEAAKSYLGNEKVHTNLHKLGVNRLEFHQGLLTFTLTRDGGHSFSDNDVTEAISSAMELIQIYEAGSPVRILTSSLIQVCPYCRENLCENPSATCADCGTRLHSLCFQENGQCTTWGCNSTSLIQ
jgi:hypothetical protein